jgi:hypothetical protein
MLERAELALKILCVVVAAALIYEFSGVVSRWNPLGDARIPTVPTFAGATGEPDAKGTNSAAVQTQKSGPTDTNAVKTAKAEATQTNAVASQKSGGADTNSAASPKPVATETNHSATNLSAVAKSAPATTNSVRTRKPSATDTNLAAMQRSGDTNVVSPPKTGTAETNATAQSKTGVGETNLASAQKPSGSDTNAASSGTAGRRGGAGPRQGSPPKLPDLPPPIKNRVDWIVNSETLAPIPHPVPTGLLGIAGNYAFIRGSTGQNEMVKVGDSVGSVKLLRIGTNRVLVEEDGQPKELMIFEGYGGESLLPKQTAKNP